jgi:hypothetical protein
MPRNWKDWTVVLGLLAFVSFPAPLLGSPVRLGCDTYNVHWDCYSEAEGYCPNHCPFGVPGCW